MSETLIDTLGTAATADALASSVRELRLLAARRLALAAHWAAQHPPLPLVKGIGRCHTDEPADLRGRLGRSRHLALQVGADGTPPVSEFAVVELNPGTADSRYR